MERFWWMIIASFSLAVSPVIERPAFGQAAGVTSAHYEDVSESTGLSFRHHSPFSKERHLHLAMGSGAAWLDIDHDGWPDLCFAQGTAWP